MLAHLKHAGRPVADQQAALETIVRGSALLMAVLERSRALNLPDWWLVSGAIYNTVWNVLTGRPALTGIKDADLFYCDLTDLSYEAEDRVIQAAVPIFADLPVPLEIRNQARVHLWFFEHFGTTYSPIRSSAAGIDRFASKTHAIGLRLEPDDGLTLYAPFGLGDLFSFRITPNRVIENRQTHETKAARARSIWPEVTVEPW